MLPQIGSYNYGAVASDVRISKTKISIGDVDNVTLYDLMPDLQDNEIAIPVSLMARAVAAGVYSASLEMALQHGDVAGAVTGTAEIYDPGDGAGDFTKSVAWSEQESYGDTANVLGKGLKGRFVVASTGGTAELTIVLTYRVVNVG